jgi:HPt (histidine-containing phosphotransfer) domain-containing protein
LFPVCRGGPTPDNRETLSDPAAILAARLAELWQTSRPIILERTAVLREAHAALTADAGDAGARSRAREAAHKLAGVLGVFGLPQGTEAASRLEGLLKSKEPLTRADLVLLADETSALERMIAAKGEG